MVQKFTTKRYDKDAGRELNLTLDIDCILVNNGNVLIFVLKSNLRYKTELKELFNSGDLNEKAVEYINKKYLIPKYGLIARQVYRLNNWTYYYEIINIAKFRKESVLIYSNGSLYNIYGTDADNY